MEEANDDMRASLKDWWNSNKHIDLGVTITKLVRGGQEYGEEYGEELGGIKKKRYVLFTAWDEKSVTFGVRDREQTKDYEFVEFKDYESTENREKKFKDDISTYLDGLINGEEVDTNRGGKRKYRRSRKSKKSRKSKSRKSKSRKGKSRKSNRRR
jgi:hypothetical protein